MALFQLVRGTPRPVDDAWRRVTDWPQHARGVPFTSIQVTTAPPARMGSRFVARTGVGRLGFDDPMEVVEWRPPVDAVGGRCRIEKRGRVVTGWAELSVEPDGTGARVLWREDARVWNLPRAFDPVIAFGARLLFGRVLRRLLAD
jgi:Polyketide cyclase / dehydrase and lipid transport